MYPNLNVRVLFLSIYTALFLAVSCCVYAEETELPDSVIFEAADTLDPDPEWYVAPLSRDFVRAGKRALLAAAPCTKDSVQIFNVDSVLTGVMVYEYGDTTRTMTWTVNSDGSRFGTSRSEEKTTGDITFTASYEWDFTANDWKGISKEEHTYAGNKETLRTLYDWQNGAWSANKQYTWVYDAAGRETEYTTYVRNSAGVLAYSEQRLREYNTAGRTILDIQYTAHNGTDWSAGTKKVYEFDASNNQILYEYYSAYTNGAWLGSSKEIWEYTAGKKTYYEKDIWSNGDWVGSSKEMWTYNSAGKQTYYEKNIWSNGAWGGSSKEIWEFNVANKQTLHEKYGWTNGDWAITLQENSGYDAAGNNILIENYSYTNGVQKGSMRTTYTFNSANKQTGNITYKWTNNAWVENVWTVTGYDAAGNKNESCKYNWENDAWVGSGNRTLTTYNSSKQVTDEVIQTWSTEAVEWVNATRKTTEYEGSKTTQEATYVWQNDAWAGTSRNDWHYNAVGQNDTIKTYTYVDTEWIYSDRTTKTYNAAGSEIMVHNAHWDGAAWVMTSMTRKDISDVTIDGTHQTLNASWRCGADSVWIGVSKDSTVYTASGKTLYRIHCQAWFNNDWVPSYKIEYEYDDAERVLIQQQMDWNNSAWKGRYRYEYSYDESGNQTLYATYNSWSQITNNWVGTSKTETVYDSRGQIFESVRYTWKNNDWSPAQKYVYDRDGQSRTIQYTLFLYANGEWVNSLKSVMDYFNNVLSKENKYEWANNQWRITSRQESYYDDDAQAKLRREIKGSWNNGNVTSFTDNHYFYSCDPHLFTIRFLNENGAILESKQVQNGTLPAYSGAEPTKEATAEFTYTFAGWDKTIAEASGDATYTATFSATKRQYTITWLNEDGSEISHESLEYGLTPAPADIYKESTAEYTYTFTGWDKEITPVEGDATYTATFTATKRQYTITWLNEDNSQLAQTTVEYGVMPTAPEAPSKGATAEYTYAFSGWNKELVAVEGDATYTATFTATKRQYTVTWLNEDNSQLAQTTVEYGVIPTAPEAPSKGATAEYTYAFAGWDKELVTVEGDATYTATFSAIKRQYTITWLNEDNSQLAQTTVEYGVIPTAPEAPSKGATAEYTYAFSGWDKEFVSVEGDATYKATFTATKRQYMITWLNEDNSQLAQTTVEYGVIPTAPEAPSKGATAEYTYTFAGWGKEIASVTGDETYQATFTATKNKQPLLLPRIAIRSHG